MTGPSPLAGPAPPGWPAEVWERVRRQDALAAELLAADPSLGPITAHIVAGDRLSAEAADERLAAGDDFDHCLVLVGSYARLDWAYRAAERGAATRERLLDLLPELWRGSDPDDADPRWPPLWREAFERNGRRTVLDGYGLPRRRTLTVYRGQDRGASVGLAWSLDPSVARRFAAGAALRQSHRPGVVLAGDVARRAVLAYLTGRGRAARSSPTPRRYGASGSSATGLAAGEWRSEWRWRAGDRWRSADEWRAVRT